MEVFYDCWRARGISLSVTYFVGLVFFGNIIMMNLFLAMLLGNFEKASLINGIQTEENKLKVLYPSEATKEREKEHNFGTLGEEIDLKPCLKPSKHLTLPADIQEELAKPVRNKLSDNSL